jgi:hypothetical protein
MKLLSLFSLLLLFTACGNSESDAAEAAAEQANSRAQEVAYQSMMDGHDRIMPLMGQITQAQRTITEQLSQGGHGEDYRELLLAANEQLEDANDGMMDWMNSVRPLDELRADMSEDEVMEYLKERTRSITDVETDIKTSLAAANEVLGSNHVHGPGTDHDHDH